MPVEEEDINKLQAAFNTYGKNEVEAIVNRIENCRRLFIDEGSGDDRRRCLCSVLRNVSSGNNGLILILTGGGYVRALCSHQA